MNPPSRSEPPLLINQGHWFHVKGISSGNVGSTEIYESTQ